MKQKQLLLSFLFIILNVYCSYAKIIYSQNFSSGTLEKEWGYYTDYKGIVSVYNNKLVMHSKATSSNASSPCSATLTVDLSQNKNVFLSFFQASFFSSSKNELPYQYTGYQNGNGVSISNDGQTWYCIVQASELESNLQEGKIYQVNLDKELQKIKFSYDPLFSYSENFKIKFQRYGSYSSQFRRAREWSNIELSESEFFLSVVTPIVVREGDKINYIGKVLISDNLKYNIHNTKITLTISDSTEIQIPSQITIPAGQNVSEFNIKIIDDTILDNTQTTNITSSATGWNPASSTISIQDNDTQLSIPTTAKEGDGILLKKGKLTAHVLSTNTTFTLSNSNPTELQIPSKITIPAGQSTAEFDIKIIDDTILDNTQTATITASAPNWNSSSAIINIQDNEENTIQFQTKTQMRNQDGETSITIIHTGTGEASIDYKTFDGSAISSQDYLSASGTLNFAPNEQQKDIKVIILDKPLRTTDTNFSIKLSNPSGASIGNNDTTTITISGRLAITQNYTQNFNSMPGSSWQYRSSNNFGRIQVVDGRLKMDTWKAKETILNEAELSLNLAWAQNVSLSFEHWKHYETEDHAMPEAYTEHCNADGIAVSTDGYQWYRIINASGLGDNGNKVQVDLNEKISNIQKTLDSTFSFSDNFIVRFQHYDTKTLGREWDNITINVMGDTLSLDSGIEGQPDEPFIMPLHLFNANHQPIKGIYAVLSFDSNVLIPKTAYLDGGILDTENYQVYVDTSVPDEMLISLFSNSDQYCYSSGIVAFLEFTAGSTMYLTSI